MSQPGHRVSATAVSFRSPDFTRYGGFSKSQISTRTAIEDVQKAKGKGKLEDLFKADDVWVVE